MLAFRLHSIFVILNLCYPSRFVIEEEELWNLWQTSTY